jgi:glycosyltransferase involved in cell wall biosynthesis
VSICFPFRGTVVGGSHLSSLLLVQELRARGADPLVTLHAEGALSRLLDQRSIPWELVELPAGAWDPSRLVQARALPATLASLRAYLTKRDVDVIHTNDGRMHRLWGTASRLSNVRWVLHHRTRALTSMMAVLARTSDALLTISGYAREQLPASLSARTQIIDNPFDTTAVPPDRVAERRRLASELGADPATRIVGFVSNLRQARKRPTDFVDMAALLRHEHGAQAVYPMFGAAQPQTMRSVLARAERRGLGQHLRLMGPRIPIEPHIAACDIIIVPAVDEPFGRTLVEAALVGTPVVASDSGGHPEIIDHGRTGLLYPPTDTSRGASEGLRLLDNPHLADTIAAAATAEALKRFSTRRHADEIIAVYDRVLRARSRFGEEPKRMPPRN